MSAMLKSGLNNVVILDSEKLSRVFVAGHIIAHSRERT